MRLLRWLRGEPATDDRGARIVALDIRRIRAMMAEGGAAIALDKELRRVVRQRSRGWDLRNMLASCILTLPVIALLLAIPSRGFAFLIVFLAYNVAHAAALRWLAERRLARDVARTIAAHGMCGSCGYSLRDIAPDPDGCVTCPECAGAWATERMTRAHWATAKAPLFAPRSIGTALLLIMPGVGVDARGVLHRRIESGLSGLSDTARATRPASDWDALRRDLRRIGRWRRIALSVPFGALAAGCAYVFIREAAWTGPLAQWVLSLLLLLLVYLSLAVLISEWCMPARRVVVAFLRHGACPLCGARPEPRETRWGRMMGCDACGCAWSPDGAPEFRPMS